MKFSVIMPSRLIHYGNCAQFLDQKLARAIDSVLAQSFKDFELIVISDDCDETVMIVSKYKDKRIKLLRVKHYADFDNLPRNTGIDNAQGEIIIYLDIDDYWGKDHLKIINDHIRGFDWLWYNDIVYDARNTQWIERVCNIKKSGQCGTSNICHARSLNLKWERPGYAHDYHLIQRLRVNTHGTKIMTPEYYVCHIPNVYDL